MSGAAVAGAAAATGVRWPSPRLRRGWPPGVPSRARCA
ncbi:hypothetical protein [Streptomyces sp. NA04227]